MKILSDYFSFLIDQYIGRNKLIVKLNNRRLPGFKIANEAAHEKRRNLKDVS